MSIAVCAVVRPSFCLRCLLTAFALSQLCALPLLLGLIGTRRYAYGWPAALCCLLAACALLRAGRRAQNGGRLDISPAGSVRLTVYQSLHQSRHQSPHRLPHRPLPVGVSALAAPGAEASPAAGEAVALATGSTLWPGLLCLCWRGEGGRKATLLAWPGNVANGNFRALALACRAIAARDGTSA